MNTTKVVSCNCASEFQDKEYGKGRRLANLRQKGTKGEYVCTVCGKVHK